jgi:hypothetical protein
MPTSKVHRARSVVPGATRSESATLSADRPAAAKASDSPRAAKGLPLKARKPASQPRSDGKAGVQASIASKAPVSLKKSGSKSAESPSELIDARIEDLGDWRGEMLSRLRALIKEADPEAAEEWKWRGTPVWSHNGLICTGETYKNVVKMTFAKGASLTDPSGLFNASLDGNARRAIDLHEGDKLNEKALKALIRAAVALNTSSARG